MYKLLDVCSAADCYCIDSSSEQETPQAKAKQLLQQLDMEEDYPSILAVKQLLTQQQQEPWLAELVYDQHIDLLSILSVQLGAISLERQHQRERDAPSKRGGSPRSVSADDASALQREVSVCVLFSALHIDTDSVLSQRAQEWYTAVLVMHTNW
jgi:hypothetical protein